MKVYTKTQLGGIYPSGKQKAVSIISQIRIRSCLSIGSAHILS